MCNIGAILFGVDFTAICLYQPLFKPEIGGSCKAEALGVGVCNDSLCPFDDLFPSGGEIAGVKTGSLANFNIIVENGAGVCNGDTNYLRTIGVLAEVNKVAVKSSQKLFTALK